jgi:hypothetical protein
MDSGNHEALKGFFNARLREVFRINAVALITNIEVYELMRSVALSEQILPCF